MISSSLDYVTVTEVADDEVTREQIERMARRYSWAAPYCRGRRVLEVACGTAQGVGYLMSHAASFAAGDISWPLLSKAKAHYANRCPFVQFDAEFLPFAAGTFDVIIIFEAIYYLSRIDDFLAECRRVAPRGTLLIATANKDLFDFNPSPHSHEYYGVVELDRLLRKHRFVPEFYGDTSVGKVSLRQRILRPAKATAARLRLIPRSMGAKKLLKRLVFGGLTKMPREIDPHVDAEARPLRLRHDVADSGHKVIFCAATSQT
ncbi:MAG: class I SAM-dependent methyltransferase [Gemmatimonadales bacterium]